MFFHSSLQAKNNIHSPGEQKVTLNPPPTHPVAPRQSESELLEAAEVHTGQHRYAAALAAYQELIGRQGGSSKAEGHLLEKAAGLARKARKHDAAFELHYHGLAAKGRSGATAGQYLISYTELITDRYLGFNFDGALQVLGDARKHLDHLLSEEVTTHRHLVHSRGPSRGCHSTTATPSLSS